MILNPDIYFDLAMEILSVRRRDREDPIRLMFAGKEPLNVMENLMKKVKYCIYDNYGVDFHWVSIYFIIFY